MIPVPNRTTWRNYFNGGAIHDCDVEIADQFSAYAQFKVTGKDLLSFSYKGKNSFIMKEYPTEEIVFVVKHYASLSSTAKTFLAQRGKRLHTRYTVNGTTTTGFKCLFIDKSEVDVVKDTVKVTLRDPFYFLTGQNSNAITTNNRNVSQVLKDYVNLSYIGGTSAFNTSSYGYVDSDDIFWYHQFSKKINIASGLRDLAVVLGETLHTTPTTDYTKSDKLNIVSLGGKLTDVNYFYTKNIYDDYAITVVDDAYPNISIYSYQHSDTQTTTVYVSSTTIVVAPSSTEYGNIIGATRTSGSGTSTITYTTKGVSITNSGGTGNYTIQYQNLTVKENLPQPYIVTTALNDVITANLKFYYQFSREMSFRCRIDPTIQPLDVLRFNNTISDLLAVEEVSFTFDGAFEGTVKGKLIDKTTIQSYIKQPIIDEVIYDQSTGYLFLSVLNPNGFACDVYANVDGHGNEYLMNIEGGCYGDFDDNDQSYMVCQAVANGDVSLINIRFVVSITSLGTINSSWINIV